MQLLEQLEVGGKEDVGSALGCQQARMISILAVDLQSQTRSISRLAAQLQCTTVCSNLLLSLLSSCVTGETGVIKGLDKTVSIAFNSQGENGHH